MHQPSFVILTTEVLNYNFNYIFLVEGLGSLQEDNFSEYSYCFACFETF